MLFIATGDSLSQRPGLNHVVPATVLELCFASKYIQIRDIGNGTYVRRGVFSVVQKRLADNRFLPRALGQTPKLTSLIATHTGEIRPDVSKLTTPSYNRDSRTKISRLQL